MGSPQGLATASAAASWLAIASAVLVHPAAGWLLACHTFNVPIDKTYTGLCIAMLLTGNFVVALTQVGVAALHAYISSPKSKAKQEDFQAEATEGILAFV